jgi:hypothetical protein
MKAQAAGVLLLAAGCAPATGGPGVAVVDIPPALPVVEAAAPELREPASILGHWQGVGKQESGASWKMLVDVVALGPGLCGRARYPSIPCAADWICTEPSDGRTLRAREHITTGRDACIEGGEMTMQLTPEGALEWSWTGSGEVARSLLTRTRGRD